MKRRNFMALAVAGGAAITLPGNIARAAESQLVRISNGKLTYKAFANKNETNADNIIPDFSYAGYNGGGVPLPARSSIPVRETLSPGSGDDRQRIQDAIDRVAARSADSNGFRGAVLLKKGEYQVSGELYIRTSGVVLRGEGQTTAGTLLVATATRQHDLINVGTKAEKVPGVGGSKFTEQSGTRTDITTAYVGSGRRTFTVKSASGYSVGEAIIVVRTPDKAWIDFMDMGQYGWVAKDYVIQYERRITKIDGNSITIDIPLVQSIATKFGGGHIAKYTLPGRIQKVGVEDLRIASKYAGDTDEKHGWNAVILRFVQNSWVRNVTAKYFGFSAVNLDDAVRQVTVQDCAYLDGKSQVTGGRRYSFNISGSSASNLLQRLYTETGRHDLVTGSAIPGPNVFLDCLSTKVAAADTGPHQRYATGLLLDNIQALMINVQNRKALGTGHGYAGAQTLFWNTTATSSSIVDSPPGASNWSIGSKAKSKSGSGTFESFGTPVTPRSLYLQQLRDRLGAGAVEKVTVSAQRGSGTIYSQLQTWGGNANPLSS